MTAENQETFRQQLLERKQRIEATLPAMADTREAARLLKEVDGALERLDQGYFGVCEVCRGEIEGERLAADPTLHVCLGCLTEQQQRAIEYDLELAARIQTALLPRNPFHASGWECRFHYEPAGPVSGDYCDLIESPHARGKLFFALGDVSGKGLAASMLVAHLHAMVHSLAALDFPVTELAAQINRLLCQSTMTSHYATLACGVAGADGGVEFFNAGHMSPLWITHGEARPLPATGVPVGLFCDGNFSSHCITLARGDTLLLYSDGLSEAFHDGREYGLQRVAELATRQAGQSPRHLVEACLADLRTFMDGAPLNDDLTLMALRRVA
jgi:sigma-B regulation protein RsbU (phosphoserine phosphatase)